MIHNICIWYPRYTMFIFGIRDRQYSWLVSMICLMCLFIALEGESGDIHVDLLYSPSKRRHPLSILHWPQPDCLY